MFTKKYPYSWTINNCFYFVYFFIFFSTDSFKHNINASVYRLGSSCPGDGFQECLMLQASSFTQHPRRDNCWCLSGWLRSCTITKPCAESSRPVSENQAKEKESHSFRNRLKGKGGTINWLKENRSTTQRGIYSVLREIAGCKC